MTLYTPCFLPGSRPEPVGRPERSAGSRQEKWNCLSAASFPFFREPERSSGPAGPVLTFGSLGQAKEQQHGIMPIILDPKRTNPGSTGKPFRINVIVLSSLTQMKRQAFFLCHPELVYSVSRFARVRSIFHGSRRFYLRSVTAFVSRRDAPHRARKRAPSRVKSGHTRA